MSDVLAKSDSNLTVAAEKPRFNIWILFAIMKFIRASNGMKFLKARLPRSTIIQLERLVRLRLSITRQQSKLNFLAFCDRIHMYPRQFSVILKRSDMEISVDNLKRVVDSHVTFRKRRLEEARQKLFKLQSITEELSFYHRIKFFNYVHKLQRTIDTQHLKKSSRSLLIRGHSRQLVILKATPTKK